MRGHWFLMGLFTTSFVSAPCQHGYMSTPGTQTLDQRLSTADELLRALAEAAIPGQELVIAAELEKLASRVSALRLEVLGRAADALLADQKVVPVADQVHAGSRCTRRAARGDVRLAQKLAERFEIIALAWRAGEVSEAQARAIITGLGDLPSWIGRVEFERCQHQLVCLARDFDPDDLRRLAQRMVEVICPESADIALAERTEREARLAFERRFLKIVPDHHGSMLISGQVPVADGELFLAQLDALVPSAASYRDLDQPPTLPARRADALVRLIGHAAASGGLPARGGDRPQVIITISLETLRHGLGPAALLESGELVSAGEARRLACDADLIPAVLGTGSQPLDVGRTHRLFTGSLRTALSLRDQGCAFPGCDVPAARCECHHILPWYLGGKTCVSNGVLLCPFHHRMVEPDPRREPGYNWQICLDDAGRPLFIPPRQVDLQRRPRQHHRYRLRDGVPEALEPPLLLGQRRLPEPSPNWTPPATTS